MDLDLYRKSKPVLALYDPTYDLLDLNTLPRLLERMEQLKISYKYNGQKRTISTKLGKIILRSMDAPNRIVAYECFRSYIDELETLRPKQIVDVWNKINGRNRQVLKYHPNAKNRTYTFTTPDAGFGFTYETWGRAKDKTQFDYVTASTTDNPHLPDDYVQNLYSIYPEGMVKAFIHGQWTNIAQGVVYTEFNRETCHATYDITPDCKIVIGQDFNVGGCISVVGYQHQGVLYIVDEFVSSTTYEIKGNYDQRYKNQATIYPDASGAQRSTNATTTDINILRTDGFYINARDNNPRVSERVLSVNSAFKQGKLKIDTVKCPRLTEALEKQAYTENGEPEKFNNHPAHDDFVDALGYLNFSINPIIKPNMPAVRIF